MWILHPFWQGGNADFDSEQDALAAGPIRTARQPTTWGLDEQRTEGGEPHDGDSCFTEAARLLVSNACAAERLLTAHRPAPNGGCIGCGYTQTRWPCALVAIGRRAQELAVLRNQ